MSLKKVSACIKRNKNFLVTTHTSLEGDALGSELAFYGLLKALGKNATIVNEDNVPYGYDFLAGLKHVKKFKKNLKGIKFDCFVNLDCSGPRRCGQVYKLNKDNKPILNIDHHISNEKFGEINWIEPTASSCSEMIYRLFKELHVPFDRDTALALYVGMVTDTGCFRYANTTSFTHKAVSELLRYNINASEVYRNIYGNVPFQDMELLTKILPKIRITASGKIAWFQIRRRMLMQRKISFDLTEHILSFARAIKGVEVAVLFREDLDTKNEVRVNLRSQGRVDVNKIACFFNGGGHRTASGATVQGDLGQVTKKVLDKIRERIK